MLKWLFTDKFREKIKKSLDAQKITNTVNISGQNYTSKNVHTTFSGKNIINITNNDVSYQRTIDNGKETIRLNGKVLEGKEAQDAKKKYESWVDDFNEGMEEFREDMVDFAKDMRDMAKDMKNMFK